MRQNGTIVHDRLKKLILYVDGMPIDIPNKNKYIYLLRYELQYEDGKKENIYAIIISKTLLYWVYEEGKMHMMINKVIN